MNIAIGAKNGLGNLSVSNSQDDKSTLNKGKNIVPWDRDIPVPVLTLDCLIEHFGMPDYVKIDVEGYENSVLAGLSVLPGLLSFESNSFYAEDARQTLNSRLLAGSGIGFNVTDESGYQLELPEWVPLREIRAIGETIIQKQIFRDIYVLDAGPQQQSTVL